MIDVLTCRGAGEPLAGINMLDAVKLDSRRFRPVRVPYSASIGIVNEHRNPAGPLLRQSVGEGCQLIADMTRRTPNEVGLIGFSLGALVVSQFLEDLAARAAYTRDCHIKFAAFVSNPRRAPVDGLPGFGIAGIHGSYGRVPTYEVARPSDGIACCPASSPLRRLADFIVMAQQPQRVDLDWIRDPLGALRAYRLAGQLIGGYLRGEHTTTYITEKHFDRLSDTINAEVW